MFIACTINYSLEVVVDILFACFCDCVCDRVFFWECTCRCFVKYNSSWVTNIFTCRQYLKYELFLYWPIEVIVKDKALKQWLKKFHLFLQEKNIKKETNEKRIKELIWCYYHRADFWTEKVFIQLSQEPITADRVGALIAKPGRWGRSFAFNFIFIFYFF